MCLAAAFVMGTIAAMPALAKNPGEFSGEWTTYRGCPIHNAELQQIESEERQEGHVALVACFVGETESGYFRVGKVTTPLSRPVVLQGAVVVNEEGHTNCVPMGSECGEGKIYPAEAGYKTLESPELEVPGGLKKITPAMRAGWPTALKEGFQKAKRKHELGLTATIEVAGGNRIYEEPDGLSSENLVSAQGTAFELPLKVKLKSPLLTQLQEGNETCYVGSEEDPVIQHLTTGISVSPFNHHKLTGLPGTLHLNEEYSNIELRESSLVDNTWAVPTAAEGCGGSEYGSYIEEAINGLLELNPSESPAAPAGKSKTVLTGTLHESLLQYPTDNYNEE